MFDLINKPGWPEESQTMFSAQTDTKQLVKTDEVVHMGVGNKNVGQTQYFLGRQCSNISQVKHQRTPFKQKIDKENWILEITVDQLWMKQGFHWV